MSRPDSFTNAVRGLLDPEAAAIEAYVASLEGKVDLLRRLGTHLANAAGEVPQYAKAPVSEWVTERIKDACEEWDDAVHKLGCPS